MLENIETVTAKTLLRASDVEYFDYVVNHIRGCPHMCQYPCYAYRNALRYGRIKTLEEWKIPKPVSNAFEILKKEIPRYKNKIKSVQLCSATDPFPFGYKSIEEFTMEVIKLLNSENIKVNVLTKGILPIELANMSPENEYGISLVSLDERYRQVMEPGASSYIDRIAALKRLKKLGARCWVSIEPFPVGQTDQELYDLLRTIEWVDFIVFGRINHNKNFSRSNYREYYADKALKVLRFCAERNIACHIKNGTLDDVYYYSAPVSCDMLSTIPRPNINMERVMRHLNPPMRDMVKVISEPEKREMVKFVNK